MALNLLSDVHLAEDATQHTIIEMWRILPRLREPQKIEGWAHRIVVNACRREGRRKTRWLQAITVTPEADPKAGQGFASVAHRDQLERGFRRLPAEQREVVERNVLRDGAGIMDVFAMGDGTVIRDNTITDGRIEVGGNPLIEGNTVSGAGSVAISSMNVEGDAGAPVIRNNTIRDSRSGIQVGSGGLGGGSAASSPDGAAAVPQVSGNDISAEMNAISVNHADATISENTIHDSWNGIVLFGSGSAEIAGNEIDVEWVGIDIGKDTSPSVDGNSVCAGNANIKVHDTATPSMGENTTCDPA